MSSKSNAFLYALLGAAVIGGVILVSSGDAKAAPSGGGSSIENWAVLDPLEYAATVPGFNDTKKAALKLLTTAALPVGSKCELLMEHVTSKAVIGVQGRVTGRDGDLVEVTVVSIVARKGAPQNPPPAGSKFVASRSLVLADM